MTKYAVVDGPNVYGPFDSENAAHDWIAANRAHMVSAYPDVVFLNPPDIRF